jgi:hypothetical protein
MVPFPSVSILFITLTNSLAYVSLIPVKPSLNSSIVNTPSPFLSNYLNNLNKLY